MKPYIRGPLVLRLWRRVARGEACWLWTGNTDAEGYGRIALENGLVRRTHQAAWIVTYGPIPPGLHVLHECDNPPCVNPAHLWLGTHADNMADRDAKGRGRYGWRSLADRQRQEVPA